MLDEASKVEGIKNQERKQVECTLQQPALLRKEDNELTVQQRAMEGARKRLSSDVDGEFVPGLGDDDSGLEKTRGGSCEVADQDHGGSRILGFSGYDTRVFVPISSASLLAACRCSSGLSPGFVPKLDRLNS